MGLYLTLECKRCTLVACVGGWVSEVRTDAGHSLGFNSVLFGTCWSCGAQHIAQHPAEAGPVYSHRATLVLNVLNDRVVAMKSLRSHQGLTMLEARSVVDSAPAAILSDWEGRVLELVEKLVGDGVSCTVKRDESVLLGTVESKPDRLHAADAPQFADTAWEVVGDEREHKAPPMVEVALASRNGGKVVLDVDEQECVRCAEDAIVWGARGDLLKSCPLCGGAMDDSGTSFIT